MKEPVLRARIDSVMARALQERRIVGAVVLVSHHGELVCSLSAGRADRESGLPMKEDSIFLLASVTKPMVTAAALRLIEDGILSLEDPVTRWLPDFRPRLPGGVFARITVRHLLTHRAGLSYRGFEPAESAYHTLDISDGLDQPGLSLAENLRRLAAAPLVYEPGSAWRYSLATDVLGAVIAEAGRAPLENVVRQAITGPLGMEDTGFTVVDRTRFVTPYADGPGEPVRITDGMAVPLFGAPVTFAPSRIFNSSSYQSGGAGMAGTARDVMRFLESIRMARDGILRASTVATMLTAHVDSAAQTWGPGWGFGFGGAILEDPAAAGTPQSKGTFQWGGVYGHTWFVDRANALSVVALTNTAFEGMTGVFPCDLRDCIYAWVRE